VVEDGDDFLSDDNGSVGCSDGSGVSTAFSIVCSTQIDLNDLSQAHASEISLESAHSFGLIRVHEREQEYALDREIVRYSVVDDEYRQVEHH
jgi:hypothetical protein